ncbi:MAG: class F sortase [Chloroflexi bacterium]|nr:class F sortase [Chloroflexota bacterium]
MGTVARLVGTDRTSAVGSLLVVSGLMLLVYAGGMYLDLLPGSRVSVPRPAALDRPRGVERSQPAANPSTASATAAAIHSVRASAPESSSVAPTAAPVAPPAVAAAAMVAPAPLVEAAAPSSETEEVAVSAGGQATAIEPPNPAVYATPPEAADARAWRDMSSRPPPANAVGLRIPRIKLETQVAPAGVVLNKDGELEWETLPFVAAHYSQTSLVGARGNAVIAGHVVTRFEGNVFRDLYLLDIGDAIDTFTEEGRFTYTVEDLQLVAPTAVEVLAATDEPILTLVTCGGEFNPRTRQFSERLVVVARLTDWGRHSIS